MKERILVTGSSGYLGNPLMQRLARTEHDILGIDNGDRERWVAQVGGRSLTEYQKTPHFNANIQDIAGMVNILNWFKPTLIIHLASQPSGPYSEISYQHRIGTQINNLTMLMNLLCAVKDLNLNTRFVVATTTGVPGAPNGPIEEEQSPNMAGSCYHVSRGFDSANLQLAAKQWKTQILELRTSIVYGTRISDSTCPNTRLDWDFWFGTVAHRFCLASKTNTDIKIYGKGLQGKPFISLRDCVTSFMHSITHEIKPGHEIMNQTTHCASPKTLASMCGGNIIHIPNPRVENEEYQMVIRNEKFMKLLNRPVPTQASIQAELDQIKEDMNVSLLPPNWLMSYNGELRPSPVVN